MRSLLLTTFLLLSGYWQATAQTGACVDTTLILYGYNCPNSLTDYNPVCACNGKTYNNVCIARYLNGVEFNNTTDGPCGDFDFYFTPNAFAYDLTYSYYAKTNGILNLFIYDMMGHIQFEYREPVQMTNFAVRERYLDISTLDRGMYILLIIKDGTQVVKRFYKEMAY